MNKAQKEYTEQDRSEAVSLLETLNKFPEESRKTVVLMANAFIRGMESQAELSGVIGSEGR